MSFHKEDGMSFDQKKHTSIRRLLDGYQSLRPSDERIKLPSSEHHIQKIFMYFVDINKYTSLLPGCTMLIGYSVLLRSDEKNLYNKSVTWHPKFENPQEILIEGEASKTNRWKHKTEIIYAHIVMNPDV